MSDLRLSGNNNNNNNNNNASEQDLILAAKRAASQLNGSNQQLHHQHQPAKMSPSSGSKRSHHLSHQHLGAALASGSPAKLQASSGQLVQPQAQHQHHHTNSGQQHQPEVRHFASHQQLASTNVQLVASAKLQQQKQSTSLVVATGAIRGANHHHSQPLDRSDSASLPSSGGSSASTSDSMFKRGRRLGSSGKWQRLLACCCCRSLSSGSDLEAADSNAPDQLDDEGNKRGRSNGAKRAASLSPIGLLLLLLCLIATTLLLSYFKPFGFSIFSCNFSAGNGAASKQMDVYNMKNGPEYYMGITEMLQSMDSTVDPCSDFYNYACGAWTRRHSIPGDESRIDTFSVMRTDLGNKLKELLEEEVDSSDSEATTKAKTLYRSCVNETLIDRRGPEPLLRLLQEQFGGWPLLGPNNQEQPADSGSEDWVKLMAILRTYNNEIIIGQTVGSHEHNSSMHAIRLYPAGLGLPSADYYNSSSRQFKAYEKYLLSTAQLLGANNSNLLQDIGDLLEFESGLANISKPFERQGGATYHRMSVARLQKYTPAIDWDTYFRYSFPDVPVNSSEQVGLYGLDFFMDIAHLINTTSSKRTVINYLLWRFVMNRVNNLGKQFADNQHEYAAEISGAKNQAPRHKVCVDYVNGNMGMAVSSLYVRKHFDAGSKQQAEIMIANIRQAFLDILHQVDWMDSETRQEAIVKAKSMLQHIGFPMWIIEPAALDQEYAHLNFSSQHYFENVIQLIKSFAKESREKLRQPSERDKWTVAPSIINAHYLRTKNLMSFPAGILQPPIYHTKYPKSLNYGGIGSIIGHEITHGFDNDGRHHDFQGNQRLWWHPNTIDRFITRSQCMVRQYDDYSVDIRGENITVSGIRTLGENIADNGGLKEAFMAYRKYEQENGPEDLLPGLNLTHHQMFFIKFAQNWCQNMTPQSMMNALKTWRHPLGRFRVIGTLSNLNEFSTAFNCPPNALMNPSQKCKVW